MQTSLWKTRARGSRQKDYLLLTKANSGISILQAAVDRQVRVRQRWSTTYDVVPRASVRERVTGHL